MQSKNGDKGFRKIGSLTKQIVSTPRSEDITHKSLPNNLPTTTTPRGQQCSTGMRRGVPGSVMPTVSEALKTGDPSTVDKTMEALLPRSVASSLSLKEREWVGENGYDFEVIGAELSQEVPEEDRAKGLAMFEAVCRPAPPQDIVVALGKLRMLTAAKKENGDDMDARIIIYAEKLSEYPGDIVLDALKRLPKMSKWFPTWHEIYQMVEWRAKRRQVQLDALRIT